MGNQQWHVVGVCTFFLDCVVRLETNLRNHACLTTGDTIALEYNDTVSVVCVPVRDERNVSFLRYVELNYQVLLACLPW